MKKRGETKESRKAPGSRTVSSRPGAGRGSRRPQSGSFLTSRWVFVGLLALATIFLFRSVIFEGMTFTSPDSNAPLGFVKVGEATLYGEGVYPLWNPYVFSGMPSFASLAYNPLIYPPDWPLALVQKVLPLPDLTWLLLYYFLGGLGIFLLCREWGTSRWAALIAGVTFLSMPNLIAVGAHGHGSQLVDSAYVPWILWLVARIFRRGRLEDIAWLALLAGFQLLRGHVQVCYYTWLSVGLYTLFEIFRRSEGWGLITRIKRAAGVAVGLGIGASLAGFLFLPVREYAKHSIRAAAEGGGVAYDYATGWSFTLFETFTFLVPGAVGFGGSTYWGTMPFTDYPHYMGLGILALAVIGIVRAKSPLSQAFLVSLGILALLIALGKHGFLYPLLYDYLPYFNKFRVPVMVLLLLQLATMVLAAFGIDAILGSAQDDPKTQKRTRFALIAMTGLAAVVLLAGLLPDVWRGSYWDAARSLRPEFPEPNLAAAFDGATRDAARVGLIALGILVSGWLAIRKTIPGGAFLAILAALTIIDLWIVDDRIMKPVLGSPIIVERQSGRDDVIDFLTQRAAESQPFRILPVQDFQSNRYAGFGLASLGGYHAAKPKLSQEYIAAEAHFRPFQSLLAGNGWSQDGFLRAANVEYIIVPGKLPDITPLEEVFAGSQTVYRLPTALPRASLATEYEVLPAEEHLPRMLAPGYEPGAVVLLDSNPGISTGPPGGTVQITEYGLNRVLMEIETPGVAILRFADLYFPGWKVEVDGEPAEIIRSDFAFRAVVVPAGQHQVEWMYESQAMRQGIILSAFGLLAVLALFGLGFWQRKKTARPKDATG